MSRQRAGVEIPRITYLAEITVKVGHFLPSDHRLQGHWLTWYLRTQALGQRPECLGFS